MIPFVTIELDRVYKLRLGMAAVIEFKQLTGKDITQISMRMDMKDCAEVLWVMLKQENKELTLEETITLIDDYAENLTKVIETVTTAMTLAFSGKKKKWGNKNRPNAEKPTSEKT